MEFGVFTFIIPDTIFNSVKKYMNYELEPDENSQILITYDNEPDIVKEFDMKTNPKMEKLWHSSRQPLVLPQMQSFYYQEVLPRRFRFQTQKGLILFWEDAPSFSQERGAYTLKSLNQIFHKHTNWTNNKPSVYNCVYYIHTPTKINAFSMLKISSNRYLFAYHPQYLNKIEVEQIVFELFMS